MISGLSFRPRPIDVNKSLPIFRNQEYEIEDPELTGVISRSLPLMPTGMEAEDEEEAHIQEAIKQSLSGIQPEKIAIPTPKIIIVPGYDDAPNPKPFVRPQAYIRYNTTQDEYSQKIIYDLDSDDEKKIQQLNDDKDILSDNLFELVVDRCEKETSRIGGNIPVLSSIEKMLPEVSRNVIEEVFNYWLQKRQENNGHPLITDFIEPPDPEDPNPYKPFRRRTEEFKQTNRRVRKNDVTALVKMKQLRQEMEKSRTLLEMIKKREKMKKDKLEIIQQIFELQCTELREIELGGPLPITHIKKKIKNYLFLQ